LLGVVTSAPAQSVFNTGVTLATIYTSGSFSAIFSGALLSYYSPNSNPPMI
jgi:hypothetical protein